jgi:hypothetical protein
MVVAFLIGFFPDEALAYLRETSPLPIFGRGKSAHDLPLTMIEGLGLYDRTRLDELGIENAQNLSTANFIELVIRTPYSPSLIIDWIGQARLYVYFKDAVQKLRNHQIRTVFDLVESSEPPENISKLAELTEIDPECLLWVSDSFRKDPSIKQLLDFRNVLHRASSEPDLA